MSEELLQRDLLKNPEKIGKWDFYNIGSTNIKTLKESGILRNINYGDIENKKVDALIVQKRYVLAVIEYKKPSSFKSKVQKQKAIQQEINTAKKIGAKIFIVTDTQETIWINAQNGDLILDENGNNIISNFSQKDENIIGLLEKLSYSINENNSRLKPKELVNPTDLAKKIWQDVWSVSGATPENCLYTFVELFIFKYLSDLNVLKGTFNFNTLIESFETNSAEEILEMYANTIRPKIKELFPANPIDKTTIINGTIFVSKDQKAVKGYSTVFKKILEKFKNYNKLEHIDHDFKSQLFESFLKESISQKNWGQFFTPLKVVRAIVDMAKDEVKEGAIICDPACGVGKFLLELIANKLDYFFEIKKDEIISKITCIGFDKGFDREEQKTIILAKANMLIYFSDLIKENPSMTDKFAKLFNNSFTLKTNSILGTLSEPANEQYDLILTNPPYVTSGSSNLKEEIKKDRDLVNYYKINALGVEGLFLEWIIRALKPNGKAFIVIPDGILNRQSDKHLRKFILDECYIDGIISLPVKTFFTTSKKTYIICLRKKERRIDKQETPVFTYFVSEIGETRDIYRFDIEQNDLQEAVTLFSFFKGNKMQFEKINTDPRCKIQAIQRFNPDEHWSVDRWWTNKEKIDLGIVADDKSVNVDTFSELVRDVSETLNEFSNLLKEVAEKKKQVAEFREISLSDQQYFHLFIGKRIVKKDLIHFTGAFPIYSANVFRPIGHDSKSNIKNFDNNFVLWGIDGDFSFNYIHKNFPFVTTDHCGTIRILHEAILPEFLMIQLEQIKSAYGFDRGLRASLKNMQQISIPIPFISEGEIDIKKQQEIIEKYHCIKEIKKQVEVYKNQIRELTIEIASNYSYTYILISNLFYFKRGRVISKRDIEDNKGEYPVFSSNTLNEGVLGYINTYDFDCEGLTWTTDGIYAGTIFYREGRFSITNICGLMTLKDEYLSKNIYLPYIKYVLDFRKIATGSDNKKVMTNVILKSNISVPIPITANGEFDRIAQEQITLQYKKIDEIKSEILAELDKIEQTPIKFE